ncbi:MAG: alpha/beta hydrolase [Acidimicrobiia bacterium]|nr:alpha/beta hydrolase [Acidimicrobiia bacterium]
MATADDRAGAEEPPDTDLTEHEPSHLVWQEIEVEGRPARFGSAGEGPPVVFLHGWGLSNRTYRRALKRLVEQGVRVWAPALPGFGGTADLPPDRFSLGGYASWVVAFLDAVGVGEPVVLMGHSFGGGVAIQVAHDHPDRVRSLVLVNSIGGSAWRRSGSAVRSMAERPLWDWGIHFPSDILPLAQVRRVLPVILADAVPNLVRNPRAVWEVGQLARVADLTFELEELKRRRLPVVVLWGEQDRLVPRASFEALCEALGGPDCYTVEGSHSWLLADPDAFGEIMTNVVGAASRAREEERRERRRLRWPRRHRRRELASVEHARPGDER